MTVTGLWKVKCPTCKREADLLFRPDTQDYKLLAHKTVENVTCKSSNTTHSISDATKAFFPTTK